MKLHRFLLRPLSPWATELHSDTLYGLLLWRMAETMGAAKCGQAIDAFRAGEPPFELSSALPAGYLPMPCLPPAPRAVFRRNVEANAYGARGDAEEERLFSALRLFKKFRKQPWLPLQTWLKCAHGLSTDALLRQHCQANQGKTDLSKPRQAFEPHVSIDRRTGNASAGNLFFTKLRYFPAQASFHLYARAEDPQPLLDLLASVGSTGFGKDASTGKGRFAVELDKAFDAALLDSPALRAKANAFLCISACSAPSLAALSGWYKLETKRGKTGPGYANPFKKPFLLLREGAILRSLPAAPFVLDHLNQEPAIAQITQPLTLPCRLADEE